MTRKWLTDFVCSAQYEIHECLLKVDEAVALAEKNSDEEKPIFQDDRVKATLKDLKASGYVYYRLMMQFGHRLPKKIHPPLSEKEQLALKTICLA